MTMRIKIAALITGIPVLLVLGALFGQGNFFEAGRDVPEILHLVDRAYVDQIDMEDLIPGMYQGALEKIDENASFIGPETDVKPWDELVYQQWGLVLRKRSGYAYVLAVAPNHPARELGLLPGTYLRKIEGNSTRTMNLVTIRNLFLENSAGLSVSLVSGPNAKEKPLALSRSDLSQNRIGHQAYQDGVHVFSLPRFHDGFAADLKKFMAEIVAAQPQAKPRLVLDLRNNALGDQNDFVQLAQLFMRKGSLGSWHGKKGEPTKLAIAHDGPFSSFELFVLINPSTSRAAEWFAAVAADREAAVLVGEPSLTLAPIFEVFPLRNGAKLEIPTRQLVLPSGRRFGPEPLKPAHELTWPEEAQDKPADSLVWLGKALDLVRAHKAAAVPQAG